MQNIIQLFEEFMSKNGTHYYEFYVGIAKDPVDRLTNGHGVTKSVPNIYWGNELDSQTVRAIEKYFLNKGSKGGPGGGDNSTQYIYTYKITPHTKE